MKLRDTGQRVISWFSNGDCSAVNTMLTLKRFGHERTTVAYCETNSEDPDNIRFRGECETWFGKKVEVLHSREFRDVDDVIETRRFLRGPNGAPCTLHLKKVPRQRFEEPDDIQSFGYASDRRDVSRWERFVENNPELMLIAPLIDAGLSKSDCHAIVSRAGIEIPRMYRLGFSNNNCVGCVKAESAAYWHRIRRYYPEVFLRRSKQERELGYALVRIAGKPVFLDELKFSDGDGEPEADFDCSLFCHIAENELAS